MFCLSVRLSVILYFPFLSHSYCSLYCLSFSKDKSSFFLLLSSFFLSTTFSFFQHIPLYYSLSTFPLDILSIKFSHSNKNSCFSLSYSEWTFTSLLSEPCLLFTSLGLEAEQGAEAMGLKVKHRAAFGRPDSVCQSLLFSSSRPRRCATACTSCALNLTNAEKDNCTKAAGLNVASADATKRYLWSAYWILC